MNTTIKQYFSVEYWKNLLLDFVHALGTKKFWKELVIMTIGITIGAAAVYYFLMPSHLIIGTISGLSIVINTLIGGNADTFSYLVMGINAFLLILAFLLIGNEFGAKTVYTAMILGPLTQLWDRIYPYTNLTHRVIENPDILAQLQAGQTFLQALQRIHLDSSFWKKANFSSGLIFSISLTFSILSPSRVSRLSPMISS